MKTADRIKIESDWVPNRVGDFTLVDDVVDDVSDFVGRIPSSLSYLGRGMIEGGKGALELLKSDPESYADRDTSLEDHKAWRQKQEDKENRFNSGSYSPGALPDSYIGTQNKEVLEFADMAAKNVFKKAYEMGGAGANTADVLVRGIMDLINYTGIKDETMTESYGRASVPGMVVDALTDMGQAVHMIPSDEDASEVKTDWMQGRYADSIEKGGYDVLQGSAEVALLGGGPFKELLRLLPGMAKGALGVGAAGTFLERDTDSITSAEKTWYDPGEEHNPPPTAPPLDNLKHYMNEQDPEELKEYPANIAAHEREQIRLDKEYLDQAREWSKRTGLPARYYSSSQEFSDKKGDPSKLDKYGRPTHTKSGDSILRLR